MLLIDNWCLWISNRLQRKLGQMMAIVLFGDPLIYRLQGKRTERIYTWLVAKELEKIRGQVVHRGVLVYQAWHITHTHIRLIHCKTWCITFSTGINHGQAELAQLVSTEANVSTLTRGPFDDFVKCKSLTKTNFLLLRPLNRLQNQTPEVPTTYYHILMTLLINHVRSHPVMIRWLFFSDRIRKGNDGLIMSSL